MPLVVHMNLKCNSFFTFKVSLNKILFVLVKLSAQKILDSLCLVKPRSLDDLLRRFFLAAYILFFMSRLVNFTIIAGSLLLLALSLEAFNRWLVEMSLSFISTPISLPTDLTRSLVFSVVVAGRPLISWQSLRVYCSCSGILSALQYDSSNLELILNQL